MSVSTSFYVVYSAQLHFGGLKKKLKWIWIGNVHGFIDPPLFIRFWIDCDGRYGTQKMETWSVEWPKTWWRINKGKYPTHTHTHNRTLTLTCNRRRTTGNLLYYIHDIVVVVAMVMRFRDKREMGRLQLDHKYSEIGVVLTSAEGLLRHQQLMMKTRDSPGFFKHSRRHLGGGETSVLYIYSPSRMFYRGFSTIGHVLNL